MKKILFFATHPLQGTGYAKIINMITNYLAQKGEFEIHQFAFQNAKTHHVVDRRIHDKIIIHDAMELDPDSTLGFGDNAIIPVMQKVQPDYVVIYNDIMVVNIIKNILTKQDAVRLNNFKLIAYLDLVFKYENPHVLKTLSEDLDHIIVFTETWKRHLIEDYNFNKDKIFVLPHGIDPNILKMDTNESKKNADIPEDSFVISNMNRNSYRKCIDLTIGGFLEFVKNNDCNPKLKLFLGCLHSHEGGVDVFKIVDSECIRLKLKPEEIIHNNIILSSKPLLHSDQEINIISNMSDVCINTCCGEGFGLTTLECASLGKPIVCTGLDVFKEILGAAANYCKITSTIYTGEREKHSGILELTTTTEIAAKLQNVYEEHTGNKLNKYKRISKNLSIKYSWESVFRKLDKIVTEIFN